MGRNKTHKSKRCTYKKNRIKQRNSNKKNRTKKNTSKKYRTKRYTSKRYTSKKYKLKGGDKTKITYFDLTKAPFNGKGYITVTGNPVMEKLYDLLKGDSKDGNSIKFFITRHLGSCANAGKYYGGLTKLKGKLSETTGKIMDTYRKKVDFRMRYDPLGTLNGFKESIKAGLHLKKYLDNKDIEIGYIFGSYLFRAYFTVAVYNQILKNKGVVEINLIPHCNEEPLFSLIPNPKKFHPSKDNNVLPKLWEPFVKNEANWKKTLSENIKRMLHYIYEKYIEELNPTTKTASGGASQSTSPSPSTTPSPSNIEELTKLTELMDSHIKSIAESEKAGESAVEEEEKANEINKLIDNLLIKIAGERLNKVDIVVDPLDEEKKSKNNNPNHEPNFEKFVDYLEKFFKANDRNNFFVGSHSAYIKKKIFKALDNNPDNKYKPLNNSIFVLSSVEVEGVKKILLEQVYLGKNIEDFKYEKYSVPEDSFYFKYKNLTDKDITWCKKYNIGDKRGI